MYLDFNVFIDFVEKEPKGVLYTDKTKRELWNSLWSALESGVDLTLLNVPEDINDTTSRYLSILTQNRGKSNLSLTKDFQPPYKFKFNLKEHFQSIFILDESSEIIQNKYLRNNDIFISFKSRYLKDFESFLFIDQPKKRAIRKKTGNFHSWEELKRYVLKATDIIIADNYILSDYLIWSPNLIKIISELCANRNNMNVTIVTFNNPRSPFDLEKMHEQLIEELKMNNLRESINIVLLNKELKEHDRAIFTNYVRIRSGDSFNLFSSSGEIITKGTELNFETLIDSENYELYKINLNALQEKVTLTSENLMVIKHENRLLEN